MNNELLALFLDVAKFLKYLPHIVLWTEIMMVDHTCTPALVFRFVEPYQETAGNIVVALFVIGNELMEIDS